ncbi:MAG: riboflavin biosynthesis protein [Verrucomicrobia bacterium]|nr:riboflavin biosynthesis protein [Verrucomicrobiota bacterium]
MTLEEYRRKYTEDDAAPGWDAIDTRLRPIYPGIEPQHWGTVIKYMLGGPDPIDGVSAYRCPQASGWHHHYVTYGFSSLYYDEEAVGAEFSKYGFELTFRLKPEAGEGDAPPVWVVSLIQNIARYVFKTGKWFDDFHWMPANGPIRASAETEITGLIFVTDPVLGVIATPHGEVKFLQMVGPSWNSALRWLEPPDVGCYFSGIRLVTSAATIWVRFPRTHSPGISDSPRH